MSEKKNQNCDLDTHLHEEDKAESPENSKPVDSIDVTGVKPLHDSSRCDRGNDNNGESGFPDSANNRHLDSVLEYANKIRAFVGFEGDDSVELPPPPLPKPLVIDGANDKTPVNEDIDANAEILDSSSAPSHPQNLCLSVNNPNCTDKLEETEDSVRNLLLSDTPDQNISANETNLDNQVDESNAIENPETDSCIQNCTLDDKNISDNKSDEESSIVIPTENFSLPGVANRGSGHLENMDSGFVDEIPTAVLLKNSVSSQLTNDPSACEKDMPSGLINNGYTDDTSADAKELDSNKYNLNASIELKEQQLNDVDSVNETSRNNNVQEEPDDTNPMILETKLQSELPDSHDESKGIENAGFENDVLELLNGKPNGFLEVEDQDSSTSDPVSNDNDTTCDNQTIIKETNSCNNAEVFLFDREYVEELQNEILSSEDEVKPIPDMVLIRRLSKDVVNKVLDDAGSQIREILDERKKSTKEINELVLNAEEIMNQRSNTEKIDNNPDIPEKIDNGESESQVKENNTELSSNKNEIQLKEVLAKTYDFNDFQKKIETEMNKLDPRFEVDPDTLCGMGRFKPNWIQPFATEKMYLILYSIVGMLSGCYYTYLIGSLSTLEKRFAFKSKISGTIMMVDEITPLFLGVLIGYFGGKTHRPRMVGFGMFLSALCCFVSALPYFIYGPAVHLNLLNVKNETDLGICDGEFREEDCDSEDRPPTLAAVLFLLLGSFMKGFGNLAYYAVGLAYMDDNAKKKNTPMYLAVTMSLRLFGPFLGFLLSSACLKFYENPFDDPGFGPEDPRWIGGWWMGFLLQGILLLIFSIPISLFPRRLPGYKNHLEKSESQEHIPSFSGMIVALKRLGKNPLYVFIVLNTIVSVFGGFGHYIMLPKYMENQFRLSASDASLYSGPPALAAIMISTIIGGYLIWRFKPTPKILTSGMLGLEVIGVLGFLIFMIPQCERVQMTNFGITDEGLILNNECNINCNCTTEAFTPVCGPDGKTTYFSPCFAGCSEKGNKTYFNCSCISDSIDEQVVTDGYCPIEGCWPQTLAYTIALPVIELIISLLRVAHTMVLLRSIQPEDKSVALGTFEALLCAFGFIPFPIVYGAIVDSTCLIWEKSCGKTGNCWFYDVDKFNYLLHGSSAGFTVLSVLCLSVIVFLSGRVNDLYNDDEGTKNTATEIELEHRPNSDTKM